MVMNGAIVSATQTVRWPISDLTSFAGGRKASNNAARHGSLGFGASQTAIRVG